MRAPTPRRARRALLATAGAIAITVAALVGIALASGAAKPTVRAVHNATLGQTIVVSRGGRTLYRLAPETTHHLLCTGVCKQFWPPLTVRSRHTKLVKGKGVQGRLSTFLRPDGRRQVTLRGRPLYRYSGDAAKGDVNGRGIHSFGGVWHVLSASTAKASPTPTPTPTPTPVTPYPTPPGY